MKRIATPMIGGVITSAILNLLIYVIWRKRSLPAEPPARSFDGLTDPSDRVRRRHFLFRSGRGCIDHRVCISNSRINSARTRSSGRRSLDLLQLHDWAERHFSVDGRFSGYSVSQDWWTKNVGAHGLMFDRESQMAGLVFQGQKKKEDKILDLPGASNS